MESIIALIIAAVVGAVVTYLSTTSERYAAPARAKSPEDRTLAERLAIEADAKIDALDVQRLEGFAVDFVSAHLDTILRTLPGGGLVMTAGELADRALRAYQTANPKVAARQQPTVEIMARKLAGAMGGRDVLADALRAAIKSEQK